MPTRTETAAEVSAAADMRMAMDAMQMAQAEARRVKAAMMAEATMTTWEMWQARVRRADRAADAAAARVVEAAKAQCRAVAA